jgi:hypothetical protein
VGKKSALGIRNQQTATGLLKLPQLWKKQNASLLLPQLLE